MDDALTVWSLAAIAAKIFVYLSSFLAIGSVLFLVANPNLAKELAASLLKAIRIAALLAIVFSLAQMAVQAGRLLDDGLSGMVDGEMLELVAGTPLGHAVGLRILGFVIVLASTANIKTIRTLGCAGAVLAAFSFAKVGHGTRDPAWLMTSLVTLHVLAACFWFGALWPLVLAASKGLQRTAKIEDTRAAGQLSHRFGQQASLIVALLVLAGGILIVQLVGSWEAMWTTDYGRLLLAKLGLVAVLLSLAAINKLRLVPAIMSGDKSALHTLRRSITVEACLFFLILTTTAALTTIVELPMGTQFTL